MNKLPLKIALLLLLLLGGCGFEPLYGTQPNSNVQKQLSGVQVSPIPDRLGQLVHNELSKGVRPDDGGQTTYRLDVALDPSLEGFGFRSDESITRERVRLVARYQLIDVRSGETVFDDVVSANTSIDVVQSDFATVAAEEKARERNAQRVSDLILTRIALFFRAKEKQAEGGQ
ncbi:MAG: hypothetical protein PVF65_02365 [Sphingomonadales bacterium]|jgi:LPS-assembly lipoprotein